MKMFALIITDADGSEEFERYHERDHAEEIAHELTHQGDDTITAKIIEVEEEPKPLKKFKLQNRYEPKRTAKDDTDMGWSSCCEAPILYFESEYDHPDKGGYEGCEICGAMTSAIPERPELQPMTPKEIFTAMDHTYQSCAHDVDGEWCGSAVLDFVVSNRGHYADRWNQDRYDITDPQQAAHAVIIFNRRYGMTE